MPQIRQKRRMKHCICKLYLLFLNVEKPFTQRSSPSDAPFPSAFAAVLHWEEDLCLLLCFYQSLFNNVGRSNLEGSKTPARFEVIQNEKSAFQWLSLLNPMIDFHFTGPNSLDQKVGRLVHLCTLPPVLNHWWLHQERDTMMLQNQLTPGIMRLSEDSDTTGKLTLHRDECGFQRSQCLSEFPIIGPLHSCWRFAVFFFFFCQLEIFLNTLKHVPE